MRMHVETTNREAFELVAKAMQQLDDYNLDRQLSFLQNAQSDLDQAVERDAQYLDAFFYAGIVRDLIGKPADAIPFFDKILNNLPKQVEHRRDVVQYSRAVAWYHQYSHDKLEKAEKDFLVVVKRSRDSEIKLLARAGLAQTYAMWMIPRTGAKEKLIQGEGAEELKFIETKRNQCLEQVKLVEEVLPESRFRSSKNPVAALSGSIQGTILNARGMSTMYWTDYNIQDIEEKKRLLNLAIVDLEQADVYLPDDWANTSDMGSAHIRMGVALSKSAENPSAKFEKALALLRRVVDDLRPNYGFAFYEIGRLYRVWGKFIEAVSSFQKSLAIPVQYRDVGDSTVQSEINRANRFDTSFP